MYRCSIFLFDSHIPNSLLWHAFFSSIWYCCSMLLHSSAQSVDRQPRDRGRMQQTELPVASSQFSSVQFSSRFPLAKANGWLPAWLGWAELAGGCTFSLWMATDVLQASFQHTKPLNILQIQQQGICNREKEEERPHTYIHTLTQSHTWIYLMHLAEL